MAGVSLKVIYCNPIFLFSWEKFCSRIMEGGFRVMEGSGFELWRGQVPSYGGFGFRVMEGSGSELRRVRVPSYGEVDSEF